MDKDKDQLSFSASGSSLPPPIEVIPHRPPMLFLDAVENCEQNSIVGRYRFRSRDPIFAGHFPEHPIVPGVLLLEGAAQTLAYWALLRHPGHLVLLTGTESAKWSQPIYPEETLHYHVTILKAKLGLVIAEVTVKVSDKIALTAKIKGFLQKPSLITPQRELS